MSVISKMAPASNSFIMWTIGLYLIWILITGQMPQFIALFTTSSWTAWSPSLFGNSSGSGVVSSSSPVSSALGGLAAEGSSSGIASSIGGAVYNLINGE